VNQILLSLGGVIQKPGTDFTVSGSTLTFTTAPAANTSFFAILLGSDNGGTVTPTDASVTVGKLAIAGGEVKLDADGDTSITADTDDQIDFRAGGTDTMHIINGKVGIGTATALSELHVQAAATPKITVRSVDGTSASVKLLRVNEDDSSTDFELKNDGGVFKIISDNSSINERSLVNFESSVVTFNEAGDAVDFRVESDDVTHMLFVDADEDAVCIGNSSLTPSTSSTATHAVFKNGGSKLEISASNNTSLAVNRVNSEGTAVELRQAGGLRGSISVAGATAAFNTSSDYRLKENVSYDWDATTRLKQLKPARFNWISDDTNTLVDGFLAHEAKTVVPESVIGEKDAVDENGDVDPQQIDHSKLVPLLVKTVQELEVRIKTLEDA
jgi:hypothetical protein